jgi:hypothetical protein
MLVQTSTTIPLTLTIARDGTGGITGLAPTVAVRRRSDGYYLDWSDATFKASGWTLKAGPLTDRGAGRYERALAVTSTAGTVLLAEYTCADAGYELEATEELQVVAALTDIPASVWAASDASTLTARVALLTKVARNRLEFTAGSPGSLVLYDDDGTTPLLTWAQRSATGTTVTSPSTAPARRGAAT